MRGTQFLMGVLCILYGTTNAQQDNNGTLAEWRINFSNGSLLQLQT